MIQKLKVDTSLTVETPEGVDFDYRLAGPGLRGLALLIDLSIKLLILFLAAQLMSYVNIAFGGSTGIADAVFLLTVFFVNWWYSALFETFLNGQTPGKMLLKLRVVRTNGTPISFYEATGRNLLLAADFLPLGYTVGLMSMLMTRRAQRLGDLVFDTMVVDESSDAVVGHLEFYGDVEALRRSECNGVFDVPERTLAVIERLFEKSRFIPFDRRENIAAILAEPLRKRLGYQTAPDLQWSDGTPVSQSRYRHTLLLHRVLLTFGDHPDIKQAKPASEAEIKFVRRHEADYVPTAELIEEAELIDDVGKDAKTANSSVASGRANESGEATA